MQLALGESPPVGSLGAGWMDGTILGDVFKSHSQLKVFRYVNMEQTKHIQYAFIFKKNIHIYIYIYIRTYTYTSWVWPPPSNSDHHDYYIISRGFQAKPSFATGILRFQRWIVVLKPSHRIP